MQTAFITINNTQFIKGNQPYYFIGTNFWSAINLALANPEQFCRELDHLQHLGINNLRIMASTEGPDSEPLRVAPTLQPTANTYREIHLKALDFVLAEMAKREMYAVLCLTNFWPWSGGMAQYIAWHKKGNIPYPPPMKRWRVVEVSIIYFSVLRHTRSSRLVL